MSILFPKVRQPRQWDYRPIHYDPQKERMEVRAERLKKERQSSEVNKYSPHPTSLHRGSFREARQTSEEFRMKGQKKSHLTFWIALLGLLLFAFYFLL